MFINRAPGRTRTSPRPTRPTGEVAIESTPHLAELPIPGTTNRDHLHENMGAVNVQLTPADLREIEAGFSRIEIYGGRMDARQMAQIGQD